MKTVKYTIFENDETLTNSILALPLTKLDLPLGVAKKCPAIKEGQEQFYVIKSPDVINIEHSFLNNKESNIKLLAGTSFYDSVFNSHIGIIPKIDRNKEKIPIINIHLNYCFFSKDPDIFIEYYPAFMNYELLKQPLRGVYGSYPISNWIRPLNFVFEWMESDKPIRISRGTDLVYIKFSEKVKLEKVDCTPELTKKIQTCLSMKDHMKTNWKFLFKHARDILFK